jgi:hypothetical protein
MEFTRQKLPKGAVTIALAAKWGEKVLDEGFVSFPKRLMRCLPAIFGATTEIKELQVALAVADFLRPGLTRWPSVEYLAFSTGLMAEEVRQALKGLRAKGLVDYEGSAEEMQVNNEGLRQKILFETRDKDPLDPE